MIYIKKCSPPSSLIQYSRTKSDDPSYKPDFDSMPANVKNELRTALLKEQGYLCAYCMKQLSDSNTEVKIEHYEPRNDDNQLEYGNLLAVCLGGEGKPNKFQTCDTHKGDNKNLEINPQNKHHMDMIYYCGDGRICTLNDVFDKDLNSILNLNESRLKAARESALSTLKTCIYNDLHGKSGTKTYFPKRLYYYKEKQNDKLNSYCGILIWYLQKKVHQYDE